MREATDRHFHLLISTESNTDTINIREPAEASKIEMKRKWQGTTKEEDYPIDVEDLSEEADEDMEEDDFLDLDVDSLEDVLTIVEECSETLNSLLGFLSTHHRELAQYLQQSVTMLSHLASRVGLQCHLTTNTTRSGNSLSLTGTHKTESPQTSQDNT